MESEKSKAGVIIASAVVALILGGAGGYAIGTSMDDSNGSSQSASVSEDKPNTSTKAADTRVALNQQLRQHVTLASVALKDLAANSPEADAAVKALDNNSVELSETIGSVYGEEAQNSFLTLWRNHIGFFVAYTEGAVAGDQAKMDQAKADLSGYTEEASTFFSGANPNINKDELQQGLQTHANQVIAIIDAYAAKDYATAFSTEEEAYNHIGMAADSLSAAIVQQFPEKF